MSVKNKIFIPTLISSATFQPVRTLPHIYFYNGLKDCEDYFIQHYPSGSTGSVDVSLQTQFPYVDYYDGLTPTSSSNSLLFFNETAVYGTTPTASLYTEYWDTYVELLYNPRTRLFKASAIIPLADYFEMELNDIVQWRGNLYHLRAINDYSLKDGTCKIELLGPIIRDAVKSPPFPIPPSPIEECTFNFSSSFEGFAPTTTTTTAAPTTTTTTQGTTTTTTQAPPLECYVYEYINTTQNTTFSFGPYPLCPGPGNFDLQITPGMEGVTFCIEEIPADQVSAFNSAGLTLTQAESICNPTTTTTTAAPTTTTTTAAPTTTTTTTAGPYTIEFLMVAGGGGGGSRHAGGGGAGGFLTGSAIVSGSIPIPIVIGAGGNGSIGLGVGTNGNNTTFYGFTAHGGGRGGGHNNNNGAVGGSGGGAIGVSSSTGGASSGSQGFAGGNGVSFAAGGGGGASQTGDVGNAFGKKGGNGGSGSAWFDGIFRAGGGGGGIQSDQTQTQSGGIGGFGGGGNGGSSFNGDSGLPNTGGGGGGAGGKSTNAFNGGNGGSGVTIIRYSGTPIGSGGTITQSGSFTFHSFTGSGNFTPL